MADKIPVEKDYSVFFETDVPQDLILMVIWLGAAIAAIFLPVLNETPLRYALTLPVVLFIPGYCLIAVLFPKDGEIGLIERFMLSVGASIAVVPLIGLGLNFTPLGIRLEPLILFVTLFTLAMILLAHYRRAMLPQEERFVIRFSGITGMINEEIVPTGKSRIDRVLSIVLILLILIAVLATIYVIVIPKEGERFSEFYILNINLTADNYPVTVFPGDVYPMYIGIGNQEHRNVTYTVETWVQQIEFNRATNASRVIAMVPSDRTVLTLAHNETVIIPYNLSVNETGYNRVDFLLFNETVPGTEVAGSDRINASYREIHLWITDY